MVYQLTTRDINYLLNRFNPKEKAYSKKEIVKTSKKYENKLCLVLEGMVYLCVENDNFEINILGYYGRGEFITHSMLPDDKQGVSYFIAKKAAKIAYFDTDDLIKYMMSDKEHMEKLMGVITHQLEKKLFSHCLVLQQKTIRNKLIYYFKSEQSKQNSDLIKMPMPYSDLAEYLGVDRSAMMKELTKMKKEGLISENKHIIQLNFE